jgi:two-component system, LytTR family, response regulator
VSGGGGPLRVLVVDDERIAREGLCNLLAGMPDVEVVGKAATAGEAVQAITRIRPELMLLDVRLGEDDGLRAIRQLPPDLWPATIVVTAHPEHALAAFDVRAIDYILKPVGARRLAQAVQRGMRWVRAGARAQVAGPVQSDSVSRLAVQRGPELRFLEADSVDWIEVEGNYLRLWSGGDDYRQRATLGTLTHALDGRPFLRISRSVVINLDAVTAIRRQAAGRYEFVMRDGRLLVASRRYRGDVRQALNGRPMRLTPTKGS